MTTTTSRSSPTADAGAARPAPAAARGGCAGERDRARGVGQWPPERTAAVRLARARDTIDRAAATGDPRVQALARRHIDAVESDARTCLSRPAPVDAEPAEQAACERARAKLARMLDPDPVTRQAGTDDLTRKWPAEHLDLLRRYAEHDHHPRTQPTAGAAGQGDAVDRARAAVDAIPPADATADSDGTDPDIALGSHAHRDPVIDDVVDRADSDAAGSELSMAQAAGR